MDKDLLKLYAEYEKYNRELPGLRNEYNFLIEDIDKKKEDRYRIEQSIPIIKQTIIERQEVIAKERGDLEALRKGIIAKQLDLKNKDIEINNLIKTQEQEKKILENIIQKNNDLIVELKNKQDQETERINKENSKIDERIRDLDIKTQLLSSDKVKLDTLKNKVELIEADNKKTINFITKKEKELGEIQKTIEMESKKLGDRLLEIETREGDLENKLKDIQNREKDLMDRQKGVIDEEKRLNDKKYELEELEYKLQIKEADLAIEQKRLILVAKKYNG